MCFQCTSIRFYNFEIRTILHIVPVFKWNIRVIFLISRNICLEINLCVSDPHSIIIWESKACDIIGYVVVSVCKNDVSMNQYFSHCSIKHSISGCVCTVCVQIWRSTKTLIWISRMSFDVHFRTCVVHTWGIESGLFDFV